MKRFAIFIFGILCYLIFLVTFLYMIGFVGDYVVPKSINSGTSELFWLAMAGNVGLIAIFGLQHTVMARDSFKEWITSIVPEAAERSVYVLLSSLCLVLLFLLWQPMPMTIWNLEGHWTGLLLEIVFWIGWALVLISTFAISHFDLFGLRQSWYGLLRREPTPISFRQPILYKIVRHPLMLGFFLAFWAAPEMTFGRLLFTLGMTIYILIGVYYEERDLVESFGEKYRNYRERVPKFIPFAK